MGPSAFGTQHFEALEAAKALPPTASNITRLSKEFGDEIARWAFLQWELRKKARAKFEKADEMLFDREGLEMASHERLAELHVSRFPEKVRIADLTCGIGSHLIALVRNGTAVGYEIDSARAEMARHNLAVNGLEADIRVGNCMATTWDFDFALADPSRRISGNRRIDPRQFSPEPIALIEIMWNLKLASVKLSPMLTDAYLESLGGERWFLSFEHECREVQILVGKEHSFDDGSKSNGAWAAMPGPVAPLVGETDTPQTVEAPDGTFFEADPAAVRAHALSDLCTRLGAKPLGDSNGYLTAPSFDPGTAAAPWVRAFQVHSHGHADEKRIRADLRRLDARIEAVKVRGVKEDPLAWQKRLKSEGSRSLVLALYPVGKSLRYALLETHHAP